MALSSHRATGCFWGGAMLSTDKPFLDQVLDEMQRRTQEDKGYDRGLYWLLRHSLHRFVVAEEPCSIGSFFETLKWRASAEENGLIRAIEYLCHGSKVFKDSYDVTWMKFIKEKAS